MAVNSLILEGWLKDNAQSNGNEARFTLCFDGYDSDAGKKVVNEITCDLLNKNVGKLAKYLTLDKQVTLTGKLVVVGGRFWLKAWDIAFHGNKYREDKQAGGSGGWSQRSW